MIITKIQSNKLYLDNDEIIDICPEIIHEFKLKLNMDILNIYDSIIEASIKNKAFYYIYLKSRTRYELLSKLKLKYHDKKEIIEKVLDYLEENLYINDIDYAISYILTHKKSKTQNTMKLLQKGISLADINIAFEDIPNDLESENLLHEIEKLKENNYDDTKILIRLTRKGFRYNDIKEILSKI